MLIDEFDDNMGINDRSDLEFHKNRFSKNTIQYRRKMVL